MTNLDLKRKAVTLRREGKTYGEIREQLEVAKSTLSDWLKDIPLTEEQMLHLKDIRKAAAEKFRITMRLKREAKLRTYYDNQKKRWLPLSDRELFLAGLFLYWGEGNKASRNCISVNNTDPLVVKFALYWMVNCLKFPRDKVRAQLHLYDDMDVDAELHYWSKVLGLKINQFCKPYIKTSKRVDIDQKGGFGHGTCGVYINNTVMKENLLMAIKALSENIPMTL